MPHGLRAQMFARELTERSVLPRDDDGLRDAVVGHELVVGVERHRLVPAPAPGRVVGGQDAFERLPELGVEYGVDDGIESRVGVAQPREDLEGDFRDARLAEGGDDVDAEERHPADEEDAHDDAHRHGGFVVAHVIRRAVVVVEVDVERFVLLF